MQPHVSMADSTCIDQTLVQCRELIGQNQAVVASLHDSSFNTAAAVRVPFPATALAENPDVTVLGSCNNDEASSEVVHVHRITVVPPPFVSTLLARKNYTVIEAWQITHPMCVENGWPLSCAPFLNFLRCAMTCSTQGNIPIIADTLPPPILLDEEMTNRRNRIIMENLTTLNPAIEGLQQN